VSAPAGGRWRSGAGIAVVASSVLVLVTVRWASGRAERGLARRVAAATAGYLALVARPARGSADYDLSRLLIEARALDGLPGFAAPLEVFHGTAPLVHATARPLSPALFDRLRQSRQALAARLLKDWEPAAQQQLMALLERARDSVEAAP